MSNFYVVQTNPNDEIGGGGCLCNGEQRGEDCQGPYAIFPATTTESNLSPHTVICRQCASEAADLLAEELEPEVIDAESEEILLI